jgi:hypothetical protein
VTDRSETTSPAPSAADDDTREHTAVATATAVAHDPSAHGAATHPHDGDPATDDHWDDRSDGGDHDGTGPVDGWDDDEWDDAPQETLPERPRRRLVTPATLALAGVVLVGAGFIGGVQVQKGSDDGGGGGARGAFAGGMGGAGRGQGGAAAGGPGGAATSGGSTTGAPGGTSGGGSAGGAPGASGSGAASDAPGGGAAGGAAAGGSGDGTTVGTVANVKGSRLYVTTSDGTTVEVTVGGQATVSRLSKSSAGGVHPGDTIVVQGTTKSDGAVAATSVQAAANGLSLGGGGFGGRGGAALGGSGVGGSASGGTSSGGSGGSSSRGSSTGGSSGAVDQLFGGN